MRTSTENHRKGWPLAVLLFVVSPVLYVLGIGPMQLAFDHNWISYDNAATLCTPLRLLFKVAPSLERPVDWYTGLWSVSVWTLPCADVDRRRLTFCIDLDQPILPSTTPAELYRPVQP
jgi:hypothetical protein